MRAQNWNAANAAAQSMSQINGSGDDSDDDEDGLCLARTTKAMDEDAAGELTTPKRNGDISKYGLDTYDEEGDGPASTFGPFTNIKGLQFYHNNDDDPYVTLKEDDDELEREENEILPTDNMLVTAIVEQNVPQLHFFVYDESTEHLGPHHDLLLSSMPLCLEWLDYPVSSTGRSNDDAMETGDGSSSSQFGNYIAIGTMDPEIEIFSVDLLESPAGTGKKKRKKAKHRAASEKYHVDAVLTLSWNRTVRQMLASGSADRTVKLWDLSRDRKEGALRSFEKLHKDKVQAVQWNPAEPTVLLSGSYDRTVRVFDTRAPDADVGAIVGADVEAIRWDPWNNHSFMFLWENGMVVNFDARTLPSDLTQPSPRASRSRRTTARLVPWTSIRTSVDASPRPVQTKCLVAGRDLGLGEVFSTRGSKAKLQIWDVGTSFGARKVFGARFAEAGRAIKERKGGGVISVADDEEDDYDSDEGEE
ncbi:WD40-repeat-containing domain protein [Lactifluus volemus]|nr:WD40-repeat-containing domain protein [Lactifluus volemus]